MKKVFLGLGLFLIILAGYFIWNKKVEILNPLSNEKTVVETKRDMKVVGFLPTWMIGNTIKYTNEIDNLIFLGLEVDENGNLVWDSQSKKMDSDDYLEQKNLIWKNGGKNILGIKLFDDEKLEKLMASADGQNNLVEQLKEVVNNKKFDGVNVDFEYQNDPTEVLSTEMNNFLERLKKENLGEISLDVFVNTIIKGSVDEVNNLIESTDSIIVMAYDFHRPGSNFVGPVAPIEAPTGDRSILELVEKITEDNLPKNKIVLAFPLYGYEWKTYGSEFGAQAKKGWSALASYKRMVDFLKSSDQKVNWDEASMTPWLNYDDNGENKQIYFENLESISRKVELVKKNQIGGVGFWALGYEGDNREIWDLLKGN
jgi:spore germination protein YaaH